MCGVLGKPLLKQIAEYLNTFELMVDNEYSNTEVCVQVFNHWSCASVGNAHGVHRQALELQSSVSVASALRCSPGGRRFTNAHEDWQRNHVSSRGLWGLYA